MAGAAGIGPADLAPMLDALRRAGVVLAAAPGTDVLTPLDCADAALPALMVVVVEAAREAGCALSLRGVEAAAAPLGADAPEVAAVVARLEEAGAVWVEDGALHLTRGLCGGLPSAPAMLARREAQSAEWVEARLLTAPGCRLGRGPLAVDGVAVGITPGDIDRAVASLRSRERLGAWGPDLALASGLCP